MSMQSRLVALAAALLLSTGGAYAQQSAKKSAASPAPAAQSAPAPTQPQADGAQQAGWVVRCTSVSRDAPLECAMEQNAVLTKTGQTIVLINIRIAPDTRTPVALLQLPLGLNLPVGAKLQVDEGKTFDLQIQTCENRGCYASTPIAADLLAALRSGKQLKVSFQNMAKEAIAIPMPLGDFAAAYDKIK
ncbi:invasion protein IalB [Bradyrhizobium japonicum]|uniref:invasion associated locus B family protein n=1 Tax=Bradyrhizobium TaxID=374 RepID=UPI000488B0B2|nr:MULTISPECIES: invasion associated locus B family protein [Bradyrhizobium]MBR0881598.1 invasion associated locus B family protein [Bradyrhizobium liaoningense]MBR0944938.1 invasion associated locus B family protein [Bradyrhizobium liaoningense]MBR0995878.1 invasion associated locus B family protein [Bradyrhizobium liaoningense]MBR1025722.1 invasion associated locus B family protein [Bradyrhizobium liaoningense]MBR1062930.1 invasion associated locus B family protein [Bradyrhizobium liaoningen